MGRCFVVTEGKCMIHDNSLNEIDHLFKEVCILIFWKTWDMLTLDERKINLGGRYSLTGF